MVVPRFRCGKLRFRHSNARSAPFAHTLRDADDGELFRRIHKARLDGERGDAHLRRALAVRGIFRADVLLRKAVAHALSPLRAPRADEHREAAQHKVFDILPHGVGSKIILGDGTGLGREEFSRRKEGVPQIQRGEGELAREHDPPPHLARREERVRVFGKDLARIRERLYPAAELLGEDVYLVGDDLGLVKDDEGRHSPRSLAETVEQKRGIIPRKHLRPRKVGRRRARVDLARERRRDPVAARPCGECFEHSFGVFRREYDIRRGINFYLVEVVHREHGGKVYALHALHEVVEKVDPVRSVRRADVEDVAAQRELTGVRRHIPAGVSRRREPVRRVLRRDDVLAGEAHGERCEHFRTRELLHERVRAHHGDVRVSARQASERLRALHRAAHGIGVAAHQHVVAVRNENSPHPREGAYL